MSDLKNFVIHHQEHNTVSLVKNAKTFFCKDGIERLYHDCEASYSYGRPAGFTVDLTKLKKSAVQRFEEADQLYEATDQQMQALIQDWIKAEKEEEEAYQPPSI